MSIVDDPVAQDVRDYAAQVRAALADLGPEQVDDLTDGLEANLVDALADDRRAHQPSLVDEFGTPATYAAELRAAAGLRPAGAAPRRGVVHALGRPGRETGEALHRALVRLRRTRWFPGVEELVVALRPAWWVLRGWALAHLVLQVLDAEPVAWFWLPSTAGGWVVLLLAVVASAQWGRGRWRTGPRWHRVLRALSAFLAVAAVVLLLWIPSTERVERTTVTAGPALPSDGVVVDGEPASNLFVYDADGQPVEGAQVFDQRGRPVTTAASGGDPWQQEGVWQDDAQEFRYPVGVPGWDGALRWNVFPLHSLTESGWEYDAATGQQVPADPELVRAPSWPFAQALQVQPWGSTDAATATHPGGGAGSATAPDARATAGATSDATPGDAAAAGPDDGATAGPSTPADDPTAEAPADAPAQDGVATATR